MKRHLMALLAGVLMGALNPAHAQKSELTEGEVRRIDKSSNKITLRHGPIKNLDMPAMTMVFQVKDSALLDRLKPGDKIRFSAEQSDGTYFVTGVEETAR